MTMPVDPAAAYNPPGLQLPAAKGALPPPGQMFTLALLKAGRNGCTCESCNLLKKIVDVMEKGLEAAPDAPNS